MVIAVPQVLQLYPPGYGGDPNRIVEFGIDGLSGLGDDFSASDITSIITSAGSAAANAINATNAPAGYVFNSVTGTYVPVTQTTAGVVTAPGTTVSANLTGSMMPILLMLGGLALVLMAVKR